MYSNCIFYVRFCTTGYLTCTSTISRIYRDMQNSMSRGHRNMAGTWDIGTRDIHVSRSRRDMGHWDPGPGRHNYTTYHEAM